MQKSKRISLQILNDIKNRLNIHLKVLKMRKVTIKKCRCQFFNSEFCSYEQKIIYNLINSSIFQSSPFSPLSFPFSFHHHLSFSLSLSLFPSSLLLTLSLLFILILSFFPFSSLSLF